jgi:hypothetical protein
MSEKNIRILEVMFAYISLGASEKNKIQYAGDFRQIA